MPKTRIIFFQELDGTVPLLTWLDALRPKRVKAKCIALIKLLAQLGYELHRPHSDILRDGIRELQQGTATSITGCSISFISKTASLLVMASSKREKSRT